MNGERSGRYLAFDLGGRQYAIEVERVEVVLESVPITRVPRARPHLRGVINYRGAVIPVADLRMRFGEGETGTGEGTSIIVMQIHYGSEDVTIGMLADSVREVIDIDAERIERAPRIGSRVEDSLVAGVGKREGDFVVLLDIDEAFKAEAATAEAR
ncbi:MAG TPA: chemotaxis protein CheW [Rectinemataceae bacterium]|nr:chemotaxis protein CheW [Rectinemataceae bacterium]